MTKDVKEGVYKGEFQLVFISPELLVHRTHWRKMLSTPIYEQCLKGFIVDEAHCVMKW